MHCNAFFSPVFSPFSAASLAHVTHGQLLAHVAPVQHLAHAAPVQVPPEHGVPD